MLNLLWKHSSAFIFHEPVDIKKLNIPDYFDIIDEPMDFGTIKNKLNQNKYMNIQEFLNDINLVFNNCFKYNGEATQVSKLCKDVRDEFNRLYYSLSLEFYL
jgi:hypothetical protein